MTAPQTVYVGVDVPTGTVCCLAVFPESIAPALTVIEGWFSPEWQGVIELAVGGDPEAKQILLDSQRTPIGLGWTFVEGER